MIYENALNIYTDGSCLSRPRRGGIGIRLVIINANGLEEHFDECAQGYEGATNNQMELKACIEGLELGRRHPWLELADRIYVFTDSMYVADHISLAMFDWPKHQWCNRAGKPIDNADLWRDLVSAIKKASPRRVDFKWVKGHSKDLHNRAVDKLAKQSAKGVLKAPLIVAAVRRKLSPKSVEAGSVPMEGQTMSIRIIVDTYLRRQRTYKYKYEVLEGEFATNIDTIYSHECIRAAHHYQVRVNHDPLYPQIEEVIAELPRESAEKA